MKVVAVYTDSCRILVEGLGQLQYSVHWEAIQQAADALPFGKPIFTSVRCKESISSNMN